MTITRNKSRRDFIAELPVEISHHIADFLPIDTMRSISRVSGSWYGMFTSTEVWRKRVRDDFNIKNTTLMSLPIHLEQSVPMFYKNLYLRLWRMKKCSPYFEDYIQYIYSDESKQYLLVVCCADMAASALDLIPKEEREVWLKMALYAGSNDLAKALLEQIEKEEKSKLPSYADKETIEKYKFGRRKTNAIYFNMALVAANIEMARYIRGRISKPNSSALKYAIFSGCLQTVQYLLDPNNQFNIVPNQKDLCFAIEYSCEGVVRYFLNPKNKYSLIIDMDVLKKTAEFGSLALFRMCVRKLKKTKGNTNFLAKERILKYAALANNPNLIRYLFNPKNQFNLEPNSISFNVAVLTGNEEIIKLFMDNDKNNNIEIKNNRYVMSFAIKSGNLKLVQYFLDKANEFEMSPDENAPCDAALSGSLEMLRYFLDSNNEYKFILDNTILSTVATIGNLDMMKYLLNPENKFGLQPDSDTLTNAIKSDNHKLVDYLLNPYNHFNANSIKSLCPAYSSAHKKDNPIINNLWNCDTNVNQALRNLKANRFNMFRESLRSAYALSFDHANRRIQYLLDNSESHDLDAKQMKYLLWRVAVAENERNKGVKKRKHSALDAEKIGDNASIKNNKKQKCYSSSTQAQPTLYGNNGNHAPFSNHESRSKSGIKKL